MWKFVALLLVTARAGNNDVVGPIGSATRQGDDMINMIPITNMLATVIAAALLAFVLLLHVLRRVDTFRPAALRITIADFGVDLCFVIQAPTAVGRRILRSMGLIVALTASRYIFCVFRHVYMSLGLISRPMARIVRTVIRQLVGAMVGIPRSMFECDLFFMRFTVLSFLAQAVFAVSVVIPLAMLRVTHLTPAEQAVFSAAVFRKKIGRSRLKLLTLGTAFQWNILHRSDPCMALWNEGWDGAQGSPFAWLIRPHYPTSLLYQISA